MVNIGNLGRVAYSEMAWKLLIFPHISPCASLPPGCPELNPFIINGCSSKQDVSLSSVSSYSKLIKPEVVVLGISDL